MATRIIRTATRDGAVDTFTTRIEIDIPQGVNTLIPNFNGSSTTSQAEADSLAFADYNASGLGANADFVESQFV